MANIAEKVEESECSKMSRILRFARENGFTVNDFVRTFAPDIEPDSEYKLLRSDGVIILKHMRDMVATMKLSMPNAPAERRGQDGDER